MNKIVKNEEVVEAKTSSAQRNVVLNELINLFTRLCPRLYRK